MLVANTTQHAYIGNGELEAWVAEKTGRLQDEMRDGMDLSNKRADAKQTLSNLKADIQGANSREDWQAARDELQKFIDDHKGDPEYQEAVHQASGILDKIDECLTKKDEMGFVLGKPSDKDKEKWADKLQATVDRMGSTDQLALLQIQNLNSQVSQATQQASNLVSSTNQSMMAVISNMKG
jgi:hypothetical protein